MDLFENAQKKIANSIDWEDVRAKLEQDEDIDEVDRLLKLGKKLGIDRYNSMVQGIKEKPLPVDDEVGETNQSIEYLYDPEVRMSSMNWGMIVQRQVRALKKLVKVSDDV